MRGLFHQHFSTFHLALFNFHLYFCTSKKWYSKFLQRIFFKRPLVRQFRQHRLRSEMRRGHAFLAACSSARIRMRFIFVSSAYRTSWDFYDVISRRRLYLHDLFVHLRRIDAFSHTVIFHSFSSIFYESKYLLTKYCKNVSSAERSVVVRPVYRRFASNVREKTTPNDYCTPSRTRIKKPRTS